jgi:cytochrome c peroxidase
MPRTLVLALVALTGCSESTADPDFSRPQAVESHKPTEINPRLLRRFRPLRTAAASGDPTLVAQQQLGKMLFFDPRMSRQRDVSCNSCHQLDMGGVDRRKTSIGTGGTIGKRNAPTVYNAVWHFAQFWDGRAEDLVAQAKGPILSPSEMAMASAEQVTTRLRAIPGYAPPFAAAFPEDPIDFDHAVLAIAQFERTLVTPARWDRYLRGDTTALSRVEIEGMRTFADVGCVQCHTGEMVGASMFQRIGVAEAWPNQTDQGRFELTNAPGDRMMFKVPSLRNVTLTAPYFHDGSVSDLRVAVATMGRYQLGIELGDAEITGIVAWLGSLEGSTATRTISPPTLPE